MKLWPLMALLALSQTLQQSVAWATPAHDFVYECESTDSRLNAKQKLSLLPPKSTNGTTCILNLINDLRRAIDRGAVDFGIAEHALWSLVTAGVSDASLRPSVMAGLRRVRADLTHPLRSQALLAQRYMTAVSGDAAVSAYNLNFPELLPFGASRVSFQQFNADYRDAPVVKRRALRWAFAQLFHEAGKPWETDPPGSLAPLARQLAVLQMLPAMHQDFGREISRSALRSALLDIDRRGDGLPTPRDDFPIMKVHIKAAACPHEWQGWEGERCLTYRTEVVGDIRLGNLMTVLRNHVDTSYGVHIATSAKPWYGRDSAETTTLPSNEYEGGVFSIWLASFARGGRSLKWPQFRQLGGSDFIAHVAYEIEAEIFIDKCDDATRCVPLLTVLPIGSNGSAGPGAHSKLSYSGPTGDRQLDKEVVLDRTLGSYKIKIGATRSYERSGEDGDVDWFQHSVGVAITRRPQRATRGEAEFVRKSFERAFGPSSLSDVAAAYAQARATLAERWRDVQSRAELHTLDLSRAAAQMPRDFAVRYSGQYPFLEIVRQMLDSPNTDVSSTEKSILATIRKGISLNLRKLSSPAVRNRIEDVQRSLKDLSPVALDEDIAGLLAGGPLTTKSDPTILNLLATSQSPSELANDRHRHGSIADARKSLENARKKSDRLTALLSLLKVSQALHAYHDEIALELETLLAEETQLTKLAVD